MCSAGIMIGSRLELFVDHVMAEQLLDGATLRMHQPVPREIVLRTDRPWEGNACSYISIFRDIDRIRMYYKVCHFKVVSGSDNGEDADGLHWTHPEYVAYAESHDGIHFTRPDLGLIEYKDFSGNTVHTPRKNNLILEAAADKSFRPHGFSAFRDENPATPPSERYKAVGAQTHHTNGSLFSLTSPDGIHWTPRPDPIITGFQFDSQNLVFWDSVNNCYRAYMRAMHPEWKRFIATATSSDFINWTHPELIEIPATMKHELYTNQVMPYPRAPHIFVGFPTRYVERPWSRGMELLPDADHRRRRSNINERYGTAITEGVLMAGRDGKTFHMWNEAFLRPGPQSTRSWAYGDQYQAWGILETPSAMEDAPPELSFYATESYFLDKDAAIRRYTLRLDGFVSVNAPLAGGTVVTPAIIFEGGNLQLNISTSAAGSARVALEKPDGTPIPGYTLDDCHEIFGDQINYPVAWKDNDHCEALAGQSVRMRIELHDADLYAFQFAQAEV